MAEPPDARVRLAARILWAADAEQALTCHEAHGAATPSRQRPVSDTVASAIATSSDGSALHTGGTAADQDCHTVAHTPPVSRSASPFKALDAPKFVDDGGGQAEHQCATEAEGITLETCAQALESSLRMSAGSSMSLPLDTQTWDTFAGVQGSRCPWDTLSDAECSAFEQQAQAAW